MRCSSCAENTAPEHASYHMYIIDDTVGVWAEPNWQEATLCLWGPQLPELASNEGFRAGRTRRTMAGQAA